MLEKQPVQQAVCRVLLSHVNQALGRGALASEACLISALLTVNKVLTCTGVQHVE